MFAQRWGLGKRKSLSQPWRERARKLSSPRRNQAAQLVLLAGAVARIPSGICFEVFESRASVVDHDPVVRFEKCAFQQLRSGRDAGSSLRGGKDALSPGKGNASIDHVFIGNGNDGPFTLANRVKDQEVSQRLGYA